MRFLTWITLVIYLLSGGCASKPKDQNQPKVSFDEFQKLLNPTSIVLLEGKNQFLTVMALPGDKYPKVYRYDIKSKEFSVDYDAGRSVGALEMARDGKSLFLQMDNHGDENYQIYTYDPQTKAATHFFGKNGFRSTANNTDQTGQWLFLTSNHENKAVYSIYRINMQTKKMDRLSDGKTNLNASYISPDGQAVLAVRNLSNNENQTYWINAKTKATQVLFKKPNSIFSPEFMDAKKQYVYGISDFQRDRKGCVKIALNKPNQVSYVKESKNKDIGCSYGEWSNLYFLSEFYNGRTTLNAYHKMFSDPVTIPQILVNQTVVPVDYDRSTKQLLLQYSAANNPGSLYFLDISSGQLAHVLDYNRSSIPIEQLATSSDFTYKSFDGMEIHGILYAKPEWKTSGKKYPVVIWPHGGPDFQESHNYRKWFQYLALNDFVVFAPNFRGSTGYGKKFETLNDKDWGGAHIKDVVAGKDAVVQLPWIDANNAFIYGGSFGGFSTLSAITTHPDAFKAAVGVVAIGNLITFMKSIPPDEAWQAEFIREVGHPVRDLALYKERSPFFHVDKIKIPLQVYQAENDVRTVKAEMDDFVAEMRRQNKPVEYTVLKDVGHGLERPEAQKQVIEGAVIFFNKQMNQNNPQGEKL